MRLGRAAKVAAGYPFRGRIEAYEGGDAIAVQMKDITSTGSIQWENCVRTRLDGKRVPQLLEPSDLLVVARGRHYRASLVGEGVLQLERPAVAAPHFYVVRLPDGSRSGNKGQLLPEYLAWWLNQGPAQRYLEQHAEGTLTKSIRRSVLEEVVVPAPPLAKQRAILGLAQTLAHEQQLLQALAANGEATMAAIAAELAEQDSKRT